MKNLFVLIFTAFTLIGCTEMDLPDDTLIEPVFFLNGEKNDVPVEISAGGENHTVAEIVNYNFDENSNLSSNLIGYVGRFRHNSWCMENCLESLEIVIMAPDFNLNQETVLVAEAFPVGSYNYDFIDESATSISQPSLVRIQYRDEAGMDYYSWNHLNSSNNDFVIANTQTRLETINLSGNKVNSAQLTVAFDCDLYDDNGNLLELRNMQGVILIGEFQEF